MVRKKSQASTTLRACTPEDRNHRDYLRVWSPDARDFLASEPLLMLFPFSDMAFPWPPATGIEQQAFHLSYSVLVPDPPLQVLNWIYNL